jgi:hypothetical protein
MRSGVNWMREGLGEARHADEECVAAREDSGEDAVHDVLLADDAAGDLDEQVSARGAEALEQLDIPQRRGRGTGERGWVGRHWGVDYHIILPSAT